jgi:hypothetical protein
MKAPALILFVLTATALADTINFDDVTIFHTINRERVAFKSVKWTVKPGIWQSRRVDFEGEKFTITFDGKKVIKAKDESFKAPGQRPIAFRSLTTSLMAESEHFGL